MATLEAQVAHIWRRLGFGATRAQIDAGLNVGPAALIDDLCNRPLTTPADWKFPVNTDYTVTEKYMSRMIELMAYGANPLQERVAWILHGLVVVAMDGTVYLADMRLHVDKLRSSTQGSYGDLLLAISTQPGMLKYLSGYQNTKAHPNENYARELCELFALGRTHPITGATNYTENDVKEMARALTGWQYNWNTGGTFFQQSSWDSGNKSFLGVARGAAKLADVMNAIKLHDSWAYHVPRRFYRELVGLEPDTQALAELGQAFGQNGDLRALVTAIVQRPEFLSDAAIYARVKQPVELIANAAKLLGITSLNYNLSWLLTDFFGQQPLAAPSVAGWYKGSEWLNTGVMMAWSSLVRSMIWGKVKWDGTGTYPALAQQLASQATSANAATTALALTGIINASAKTFAALDDYAKAGNWNLQRAAGLLNLTFLTPEYFVN
jgi:uncharacterized protein (DUF1800 family)